MRPFCSTCQFIITMNPHLIHMAPGTSVVAYISQLHAAMRAHMQNPQSEFHNVLERTRTLLWSLLVVAPWTEFRQRYSDFTITGEPGIDEERFLVFGAWNIVTRELLTREELEQRGDLLWYSPSYLSSPGGTYVCSTSTTIGTPTRIPTKCRPCEWGA